MCIYDFFIHHVRINPAAVLDFMWACLHKPCLWQERVKREAVVNSSISLVSNLYISLISNLYISLVSNLYISLVSNLYISLVSYVH